MKFCGSFEVFVVVSISSATILNTVFVVPIMAHFVEKSSAYVKNVSAQGASSNIDFVRPSQFGNPSIVAESEMTISARSGLYCDCRS